MSLNCNFFHVVVESKGRMFDLILFSHEDSLHARESGRARM